MKQEFKEVKRRSRATEVVVVEGLFDRVGLGDGGDGEGVCRCKRRILNHKS